MNEKNECRVAAAAVGGLVAAAVGSGAMGLPAKAMAKAL